VVDKDLVFRAIPGGKYYNTDTGIAIQITASNVLLDFRGHSLSDPATTTPYAQSRGVFVGATPLMFSPVMRSANLSLEFLSC
jgi:hypothetical protein